MRVLMITGDRNLLKPGTEAQGRLELQRRRVDALSVVFWGRGAMWPPLPSGDFDVVTAQDPLWRGCFGWCAARKKKARLNVQVHMDMAALGLVRRALARIVLQHADSVRVVSERLKQQVLRYTRAPVTVLPIYIDVTRFTHIVREPQSQKIILWVGRFEAEKDPLAALALLEVVRKAGVDARLVMLGSGTLEGILRERAVGLPVEFPGWRDPAAWYAKADVVVCTSQHESWGVSIIEALAAGVPVVAPDVGIAREAGACIVPRERMAEKLIEVLREGARGELALVLPTAEEWAALWKKSLSVSANNAVNNDSTIF